MIQAFNSNGIDYILKPFDRKTIAASLTKFQNLKTYFQGDNQNTEAKTENPFNAQLQKLLTDLRPSTHRASFLVQHRSKYFPVSTSEIAFFYTEHENLWLTRMNGEKYSINHTLDELEKMLDSRQFYRANHQFIVNFDAIKEFEPYFNRKLTVKLKAPLPELLLVNKEKSTQFTQWMGLRGQ